MEQPSRDKSLPARAIRLLLYGFAFLGCAGLVVIVWVVAAFLVAARYYPRESGPTAQNSNTGKPPYIHPEMQKAIIESLPNASTDETPVVIKIWGQSYRLPRNYLWNKGSFPEIRVTAPGFPIAGFQPLTEATAACFGSLQQGWNAGCQAVEFIPSQGMFSAEQQLAFVQRIRKDAAPKNGPFGYDFYDDIRAYYSGDVHFFGDLRTETYTKIHNGRRVIFECTISLKKIDNKLNRHLVYCHDNFELLDGNVLQLSFIRADIEKIPEIEDYMRALMESFRIKGENQ